MGRGCIVRPGIAGQAGALYRRCALGSNEADSRHESVVRGAHARDRPVALLSLHVGGQTIRRQDGRAFIRSGFLRQTRRAPRQTVGEDGLHQQNLRRHDQRLLDLCAGAIRSQDPSRVNGLAGRPLLQRPRLHHSTERSIPIDSDVSKEDSGNGFKCSRRPGDVY